MAEFAVEVPAPRRVNLRLRRRVTGPPPGAPDARRRGCTCPVRANRRGDGAPGAAWGETPRALTHWLVDLDCPLHRLATPDPE